LVGSTTVPAGVTTVSNTANVSISLGPQYGLPNKFNASATASCQVQIEGCTPGSWKNPNGRLLLWNSLSDAIPQAMPDGHEFFTGTLFNAYFGLTPLQSGFSNTLTMEGAINLGGGGNEKLARHAVAGLLSIAAGVNFLYPEGTTDFLSVKAAVTNAFKTGTYEPLASQLALANTGTCPIQ
jgi:hypothetical protein